MSHENNKYLLRNNRTDKTIIEEDKEIEFEELNFLMFVTKFLTPNEFFEISC